MRGGDLKAASWFDSGVYATSFAGGSGSQANPYLISTPAQFARMGVITKTHTGILYFKLMSSINLSGRDWISVSNTNMSSTSGSASVDFNGNAYTIYNLKVPPPPNGFGGIFRYFKGKFYNTQFQNADINSESAAIITDQLYGTIENIQARGNINSKNQYAGGIAIYNASDSLIKNCFFIGNITATLTSSTVGLTENFNYIYHEVNHYLQRLGNNGISVIPAYTKLLIYQNIFFYDKRYINITAGEIYVGGLCGLGNGQISDSYFVGEINSSFTYNSRRITTHEDIRGSMGYTVRANYSSDNTMNIPNKNSGRSAIFWRDFRAMGLQNGTGLRNITGRCFGIYLDTNQSHSENVSIERIDNSSFNFTAYSYTRVTDSYDLPVTKYPYSISSAGVLSNAYYQSSNGNLRNIIGARKVSNMKTTNISSAWAIDAKINDGYPHLKALYWQDNT